MTLFESVHHADPLFFIIIVLSLELMVQVKHFDNQLNVISKVKVIFAD